MVEARIANGPGANRVWDEGETVEAEVRFRPGAGGHDRRAAGAGAQIARVPAGGLSLGAATIRNALGRDAPLSFEAVPVASVMEVVAEARRGVDRGRRGDGGGDLQRAGDGAHGHHTPVVEIVLSGRLRAARYASGSGTAPLD